MVGYETKIAPIKEYFQCNLVYQKKTPHLHLEFFDNLQHLSITP